MAALSSLFSLCLQALAFQERTDWFYNRVHIVYIYIQVIFNIYSICIIKDIFFILPVRDILYIIFVLQYI